MNRCCLELLHRWLWVVWMVAGLSVHTARAECQISTPELDKMTIQRVQLVSDTGKRIEIEAHLAKDGSARAAGFQHVCPDTIQQTFILFLYPRPLVPSFHMRNVYAPLDIAFLDADGRIVDQQLMQPYVLGRSQNRKYYQPTRAVIGALEARQGFFKQQGIDADGWRVVWQSTKP